MMVVFESLEGGRTFIRMLFVGKGQIWGGSVMVWAEIEVGRGSEKSRSRPGNLDVEDYVSHILRPDAVPFM